MALITILWSLFLLWLITLGDGPRAYRREINKRMDYIDYIEYKTFKETKNKYSR